MTELLTLRDVAALLRVSVHTIQRIPNEKLPRGRVGGSVRFKPEDVEAYVKLAFAVETRPVDTMQRVVEIAQR